MDDVLELQVDVNEFSCEEIKPEELPNILGGKKFEQPVEADTKFPLNPNDYLTLGEAKKALLEKLKTIGDENTIEIEGKDFKASVKSRLGLCKRENDVETLSKESLATKETKDVRPPVKSRLGVRVTQSDDDDMMECDLEDETTQWDNETKPHLKPNNSGAYKRYGSMSLRLFQHICDLIHK